MTGRWVPPDQRDAVVDGVPWLSTRTALPVRPMLARLRIARAKSVRWTGSYGAVPTPHGPVPREHWLTAAERDGSLRCHEQHPLEEYRRLTYLLLDGGEVAVSPSPVYCAVKAAGRLDRWSRYLVHCALRESMTTRDVTPIVQRAGERFLEARPRIISDNGPQFIARDFRDFNRLAGMTHVRTAPSDPPSNGTLERWNQTIKVTTIRPEAPTAIDEARRHVTAFVAHDNEQRLHSAIGYITPADRQAGRSEAIWATRDARVEAARAARRGSVTSPHPASTIPL
jgi:putative transposase